MCILNIYNIYLFFNYNTIKNEFNYTIRGKVNLTILGDVNGSGTLIAKKCGSITVNGSINVQTSEQSGGVIN